MMPVRLPQCGGVRCLRSKGSYRAHHCTGGGDVAQADYGRDEAASEGWRHRFMSPPDASDLGDAAWFTTRAPSLASSVVVPPPPT